jgi:hypothetical protein
MPLMLYSLSGIAFALVFLAFCYLLGSGILARLKLTGGQADSVTLQLLAIPVGMGGAFLTLFLLAAAQRLNATHLLAACVILLMLAGWWLHGHGAGWRASLKNFPARCWKLCGDQPLGATALLLAAALGFLLAMGAPLEWDELSYHLPYAQDYTEAGGLVVSERLRFPLHSHNIQLVWAAALLFSSEAATHLINAFCAALVTTGIYIYARDSFGRATGILAALLYLYFCRSLLDTAYVDLALSLFVFSSFLALAQWQSSRRDGYLFVSAFLLAMAVGIKYQGLLQLPAFGLALIIASRGAVTPLAKAVALFLVFGSWWYVRNWLISGDPVHPVGAPWFGYWLWDEADLAGQYADFERFRHHLPLALLPALAFAVLPGKRTAREVTLLVLGLAGLAAWYLTSRYDRYLIPSIPFLAILSSEVIVQAAGRMGSGRIGRSLRSMAGRRVFHYAGLALLVLAAGLTVRKQWSETCFTEACIDRVYSAELLSYPVADNVPGLGQLKLYQFGLENELYTLPDGTAGDWFGPYRYRDIYERLGDPPALGEHLQRLDRDSILVNRAQDYFGRFPDSAELSEYFEVLYEDERVSLYRLR